MEILTFPVGLVVGILPVVAGFAPGDGPATLLLDGRPACSLSAESPRCEVDLGKTLTVHLLELERGDGVGAPPRARRSVNRPGQEAELFTRLECNDPGKPCRLGIGWGHAAKLDPVRVTVTMDGTEVAGGQVRDVTLPPPQRERPSIVNVEAFFPDGSRSAKTMALSGGATDSVETRLTPVPLALREGVNAPTMLGEFPVRAVEPGTTAVAVAGAPGALRVAERELTQARSSGTFRAKLSLLETRLRHVRRVMLVGTTPDLPRRDVVLNPARSTWDNSALVLTMLGRERPDRDVPATRLADAAALAGLAAGASPGPRAVVVVLSADGAPDRSTFTPQEAQAYLREVMVPLVVWRAGRPTADGWPEGIVVNSLASYDDAVAQLDALLARQRVAWVQGDVYPGRFNPTLPAGVEIAGREGGGAGPLVGSTPSSSEGPAPKGPGAAGGGDAPSAQPTDRVGVPPGPEARAAATGVHAGVSVSAVRVVLRAKAQQDGLAPRLAAKDLTVHEDGRPALVLSLEPFLAGRAPAGSPGALPEASPTVREGRSDASTRVIVYAVPPLSSHGTLGRTLETLATLADPLCRVGATSVVVADPRPVLAASDLRDPGALATVLRQESRRQVGWSEIIRVRRWFRQGLADAGPNFSMAGRLALARSSLREERAIVIRTVGEVVAWARSRRPDRGGVLLLAMDGFDENPAEFYLRAIGPPSRSTSIDWDRYRQAEAEFTALRLGPSLKEAASALAEAGWQVILFDAGTTGAVSFPGAAEVKGNEKFDAFVKGDPGAAVDAPAPSGALRPREGQSVIADATGGAVVPAGRMSEDLLSVLRNSYVLTYQVARPADGKEHALDVRCAVDGVTLGAPAAVRAGTAESEAEALVRQVLDGSRDGELPVSLEIVRGDASAERRTSGRLIVRVDLAAVRDVLDRLGAGRVRVTVAVALKGAEPFVTHDLQALRPYGEGTVWVYESPISWPSAATRVAVRAEELETGAAGSAVIDLEK